MLSECVRVLKPDGYLIVQEIEYNICSTDDDVETELPNLHTYVLSRSFLRFKMHRSAHIHQLHVRLSIH